MVFASTMKEIISSQKLINPFLFHDGNALADALVL